jgi:hypothetical protein
VIQTIEVNVSKCKAIIKPHKTNNFKIIKRRCTCCNKTKISKFRSRSYLNINVRCKFIESFINNFLKRLIIRLFGSWFIIMEHWMFFKKQGEKEKLIVYAKRKNNNNFVNWKNTWCSRWKKRKATKNYRKTPTHKGKKVKHCYK